MALFAPVTSILYTEEPIVEDGVTLLDKTSLVLSNSAIIADLFFPTFIL
jgi:hypothetical protein